MIVSARVEYGCLAMLHLAARHPAGEPVPIRDIAATYGISQRFLVQILLQLKAAGLVVSIRGTTGGYRLARDPKTISLAQVIDAIDGKKSDSSKGAPGPDTAGRRVLRGIWAEAGQAQRKCLEAVHLDELVNRAGGRVEDMYFI